MFDQKKVFEFSRTVLAILISLLIALITILFVSEEPVIISTSASYKSSN